MPLSRLRFAVVAFLILLSSNAVAQQPAPPDMKWGEVSLEDLKMTQCASDTNAQAMVLFDCGKSNVDRDFNLAFHRHQRVKIFKQSAFDEWGTYTIRFYCKNKEQRVKDIEAVTYVLGPDESIQQTTMDENAIFFEDLDKEYGMCRFTLPGLKPGCVIEFRYSIISKSLWDIRDWYFQEIVPIRWTEYTVTVPREYVYSGIKTGYEQFCIDTLEETRVRIGGDAADILGKDVVDCARYRWAMKDVPAFHDEPFMTARKDYLQRVELQLAEYQSYTGKITKVLETWEQVVSDFVKDKTVGRSFNVTGDVRKATDPLIAGLLTPEDKLAAIYDYVRKGITWSGENRFWAEKDVDDVLESKKGTSAEIEYLLMSMLKHAGFEVFPIIISTRDHGKIQVAYPVVNQFDYVLAAVQVGDTKYLLDATDPLRPLTMLPLKALNTRGLIICEGPVQWINITTGEYYEEQSFANVALEASGDMSGLLKVIDREYAALDHRRQIKDGNEADILKKIVDADRSSLSLDSVRCEGTDSTEKPLRFLAHISSSSYAQVAGDLIYVNPHMIGRMFDNPLKTPTRKFAVDMMYPRRFVTSVSITIPENFEIKEMPSGRAAKLGKEAVCQEEFMVNNRTITVNSSIKISASEYPSGSYSKLRDFYQKWVTMGSQQIVL